MYIVAMANFQTTTMTVAIIILIFCLAVIGVLMHYAVHESIFPPVPSTCPDFWKMSVGEEGVEMCNPPSGEMAIPGYSDQVECVTPFDLAQYGGKTGNCEKFQKATQCRWTWDGITNLGNPCEDVTV